MSEENMEKYKIMLTDDDDFLVDMYVTKFNNSGIGVEACKSGNALLEKLRAGTKSDLILLDIVMPQITGLEVLKKMREEKLAVGIPVVMLTNQSDEKDITEAKSLGTAGYIVKSAATPSEVVSEVLHILESSKK
jgi:CheY-like chemotaxis protein